jgi:hypothetical protein
VTVLFGDGDPLGVPRLRLQLGQRADPMVTGRRSRDGGWSVSGSGLDDPMDGEVSRLAIRFRTGPEASPIDEVMRQPASRERLLESTPFGVWDASPKAERSRIACPELAPGVRHLPASQLAGLPAIGTGSSAVASYACTGPTANPRTETL